MAMTKKDDEFWEKLCAALGDWNAQPLRDMQDDGYDPSVELLAFALSQGCSRALPNFVEGALAFSLNGGASERSPCKRPQMYAGTQRHESRRYVLAGHSAWLSLLESGAQPDHPNFQACAKLLAQLGGSINAKLRWEGGGSLLAELASRGFDELIWSIQKWAGEKFEIQRGPASTAPDSDKPMLAALHGGHGDVARMMKSASADKEAEVSLGFAGWLAPFKPAKGSYFQAGWKQAVEALQIAARSGGALGVAAWDSSKLEEDPLANPKTLTLWMAIQGANAQACAGPLPDLERACARARAQSRSMKKGTAVDWAALDKAAGARPARWLAGRLWNSVGLQTQEAPDEQSTRPVDMWKLGRERAAALVQKTLPLGDALAACSRGDFEQARQAFEKTPAGRKMEACVALLGLATCGWWGISATSRLAEDRQPMMWAGFKLALAAGRDELSMPIPGLDGLDLMGLCAALGRLDACAELIAAGVSLDPHLLSQGPSPLALALAYDNPEVAQALLDAGASPLENARPGPFGWTKKPWAIHVALARQHFGLAKALLDMEPRCAHLPSTKGLDVLDAARVGLAAEAKEERKPEWEAVVAATERALLAADLTPPEGSRPQAVGAPVKARRL
jgi:hypothetical protein